MTSIHNLGYESLRYSIFSAHRPSEWETRLDFNSESKEYEVYSTMSRASVNGKEIFSNFEDAKNRFLEILQNVMFINQYYVEEGMTPGYDSPLWEKK